MGTFAFDELPKQPSSELFSLVVNTSSSREPGDHWLCLVYKKSVYYFLDSYGRDLQDLTFSQDFVKTIKNYVGQTKIMYQKKLLQQLTSNVCGDYCIYFISKLVDKSFTSVLSVFSTDLKKNDEFVFKYVKQLAM